MDDWLRERYRLHAKLPVFARKVDQAKTIINQVITDHPGNWGVSYSGGKDSTALLALLLDIGMQPELYHMTYGDDSSGSGNLELVNWYSQTYHLPVYIHHAIGETDVWADVGFFEAAETKEQKAALRRYQQSITDGFDHFIANHGAVGTFWGMRAEESINRRRAIARHGPIYLAKSRKVITALPLAYWQSTDVWAYLLSTGLPYNSRYDTVDNPDRARSEDVIMFADSVVGHGAWVELKRRDPDKFNRLVVRFPELRRYV